MLECTVIYQTGIQFYDQISILRNQLEVTLLCSFALELGSKGSKQLGPLQKLECTFLYQMGIQIYDQISTLRIWSKVKLHHSISLRFGLNEGKMALRNWKQIQPFRPWFQQDCLRSKSPESLYAWLSLKWVPKFPFKFQLQESRKNNISQTFT